ncbi:MAG: dicarboxylate/amino acid:cation symporter, partial [Hyphomonadaceae bacterium]|nr:dicarboxylate/amino acid:cation symporter [Hyphomonadaceae bacterium]
MKVLSLIVLAALVAGLVTGALIRSDAPNFTPLANNLEAFGGLWLNTLRMTVVPLVVSLLITGIASVTDTARTGGLVLRAMILFTFLIFVAAIYTTFATQWVLQLWPVDPEAAS